jgi:hypothetical protein
MDSIDLRSTHLPRRHLVDKMTDILSKSRFLLLSSSAASGKTSLLKLFQQRTSDRCIGISCHVVSYTPIEMFKEIGIDLEKQTITNELCENRCVIMLDDAQKWYGEKNEGFWSLLFKSGPLWIPTNVKFIISATYSISLGPHSPVVFKNHPRLTRKDMLLTTDEYNALMDSPLGLGPELFSQTMKDVIWKECGGLIGAVRLSIEKLKDTFKKSNYYTESNVLNYLFSRPVTQTMERCFGTGHLSPMDPKLQDFLKKCFIEDYSGVPPKLDKEDEECLSRLKKSGVLVDEKEGSDMFSFSSPMAKRFYLNWLYPDRSTENPQSIKELVQKALSTFSSSVLRNSTIDKFPKETVFQHLLMNGLVKCTSITTSICPELSQVFPTDESAVQETIQGEIDFFLNGELRWGIELLVHGREIKEHISRFSESGKYYQLKPNDYVLIDFRPISQNNMVQRHEHRYTIFFESDFSKCVCVFGKEEPFDLILQP